MVDIDSKLLIPKNQIAEGGEGILYDYKGSVLKIYKDTVDKDIKKRRLEKLITKSLTSNIVKPNDLANLKNSFAGFTMSKIEGEEIKKICNKKYVNVNNVKIKDITKMLVDIKNTLMKLHKQNIIIGDFNDKNILFSKDYNIYFIDADSWSIDDIKCEVAMELFTDPLLILDNFSTSTDYYSFAIILFKLFTRIHPFGGTLNPDINTIERMKKGISVIDNTKVTIPALANNWSFLSPDLINEMKLIFEKKKRFLLDKSLDDFYSNLKYCNNHNDYYYGKYSECPVCHRGANLIQEPIKVASSIGGIPIILMLSNSEIKTILAYNLYLTNNNYVVHKEGKDKLKYTKGNKYYSSNNGDISYIVSDKEINIRKGLSGYNFEKINKSPVIVKDNKIYFVNLNNTLTQLTINSFGNSLKNLSKVSFNSIFEVYDENNYFVCNLYDNLKIIDINGFNYTINDNKKIQNYGIHHDAASKQWLFIIEDSRGVFTTYIFNKNNVVYQNDSIKYTNDLGNMCFSGKVIYKSVDKAIRGFSYEKNKYKDFPCDVINEESKLIWESGKFIVINEKEIYKVG